MSKLAVYCLGGMIVVAALANTFVINLYGRDRELYPMTAWQMFSGIPKVVARDFVFEILAEPGAAPLEVPAKRITGIGGARGRRLLEAMWQSCLHRCPDYRLKDFSECRDCAVDHWTLPPDIGRIWLRRAMDRLRLPREPYALRLVMIERPLAGHLSTAMLQPMRTSVFTWQPRSGYQVDAAP